MELGVTDSLDKDGVNILKRAIVDRKFNYIRALLDHDDSIITMHDLEIANREFLPTTDNNELNILKRFNEKLHKAGNKTGSTNEIPTPIDYNDQINVIGENYETNETINIPYENRNDQTQLPGSYPTSGISVKFPLDLPIAEELREYSYQIHMPPDPEKPSTHNSFIDDRFYPKMGNTALTTVEAHPINKVKKSDISSVVQPGVPFGGGVSALK